MMLTISDLHQYQKDIANKIINKKSLLVIAEMGLGKTAATLTPVRWLQQNRNFGPALILAPLRVVYNSWPDEIKTWEHLKKTKYHIIHGPGKTHPLPKSQLYFSNYESIPYIIDKKLYKPCEILVIDESSMIKSHQTKRFKNLKKIAKHFKKVILLTGTPSPSGTLEELFTQVYMLDQGRRLTPSFWHFRNRYYEKADWMGYKYDLKPGSKKQIENKIKDVTITLKAKDYLQLPPLVRNTITVDIPAKVRTLYEEMEKEFLIMIKDEVITAANAAVMSSKLRQITAGGIYDESKEYTLLHNEKINALQEIVETTESNILCAFQFKFERSLLYRTFPNAQFLDGKTSATESNKIIQDWNKKKIKLLCCHPQSAGHGLNIQHGGNVLVWLSPDWSLERTQQMDARVYRQGQKKNVFIHTIACRNTVDLAVIDALKNKSAGQDSLINSLKQYAKGKQ